jgi:hypothetical protein
MVLVISLDAVEKIRKLPLTLDRTVPIKIKSVRKDPAGVNPLFILIDRQL